MTLIDVDQLAESITNSLSPLDAAEVSVEVLGDSGFRAIVDGEHCLSNVHVWPAGSGFSEFLFVESGDGSNRHVELASLNEAIEWAQNEIRGALIRARMGNNGENSI